MLLQDACRYLRSDRAFQGRFDRFGFAGVRDTANQRRGCHDLTDGHGDGFSGHVIESREPTFAELLLAAFSLDRADLGDQEKVAGAVRSLAARMPTYVTLKDVKKRWGKGQEDIFPVAQFEKLWGDMTALADLNCRFVVVTRERGQQIKEPAQLNGWLRDGSAAYVDSLCQW